MADLEQLCALIRPVVETSGFELVRVKFSGSSPATLQVMLEDPATGQMLIEDCAAVSRRLSAMLDEADPIDGEYVLEVSSPGIDRPLTRRKDFERFAGHQVRIELEKAITTPAGNRKRFEGLLLGLSDDAVRLRVKGSAEAGEALLPLGGIAEARLLMTDRLIAETMPFLAGAGHSESN